MKKIIFSMALLALPQLIFSQGNPKFFALPYATFTTYNNTYQKDYAIISGFYGFLKPNLKHTFEMDISYTHIKYQNPPDVIRGFGRTGAGGFSINQTDITAVYTNNRFRNLQWRAGVHSIFSINSNVGTSHTVFAGLKRYRLNHYNVAIDFYESFYPGFSPNLRVFQATATFGFNFGNYFTTGKFYAETKGFYIRLSDDVGFRGKEYPSIKQSLFYYHKKLTLEGFIWTGIQLYAVRNDGFVVFNLTEKYLGAFGGSVQYMLNRRTSLKFKIARGKFKESGGAVLANSINAGVFLGYAF